MNRRDLLRSMAMASAMEALPLKPLSAAASTPFNFIFFTDTHIQPELHAADGCRMAFAQMAKENVDFAICGGDLIFDGLAVDQARAHLQWDLFRQASKELPVSVHYTLGNHDVFGLSPKSGVATSDPEYGKKAFQDRYGATHYSFDHKGWHIVVLDSIGMQPDRTYIGKIGHEQIAWLKSDLEKVGPKRPVIVITHIPLATSAINYVSRDDWRKKTGDLGGLINTLMVTDSAEVINALLPYNIRIVLQGHTHINEEITFRGIRFLTSGAVSGNWWRGSWGGSNEGYSMMTVDPSGNITRRYVNYGFKADLSS